MKMLKLFSLLLLLVLTILAIATRNDAGTGKMYEFWQYDKNQQAATESINLEVWLKDNPTLQTRNISEDLTLVKQGPREYMPLNTGGECGACPRVGLNFYLVNHEQKTIVNILNLEYIEESCSYDQEYEVSSDWSEVTHYTGDYTEVSVGEDVQWNSDTYCFSQASGEYSQCRSGNEPPEEYKFKDVKDEWCGEALILLESQKN